MSDTFWMYDVTQLFRSFDLLPTPDDSLATKLNTIMRLTIVICAVIGFYKPILALSTIVIIMAITMSVFSASVQTPTQENFEYDSDHASGITSLHNSKTNQLNEFMKEYITTTSSADGMQNVYKSGFPITQKRFCNDDVPLQYGLGYISANQQLAGVSDMRTTVPPLVAPPSHDLNSWKENDFITHSAINRETNFDYSRAGYNYGILPTKCSICKICNNNDNITFQESSNELTQHNCYCEPSSNLKRPLKINYVKRVPELIRNLRQQNIGENEILKITDSQQNNNILSEFHSKQNPMNTQSMITENAETKSVSNKQSSSNSINGDIESDNIKINPCFENPRRDNIITQTIQPGVYQKSHVGEPIQSNIGISYTQEFVPTEIQETSNKIKYTQQDPTNLIITPSTKKKIIDQTVDNIYDPRFYGYGTSYRSYVDKLTGRPKFFYDDVDSITMPNYITRSKVDIFPWANTYGPDVGGRCDINEEHRQLANNSFHESALQFRTELQERLMRKRNAEMWQRRVAPIITMSR